MRLIWRLLDVLELIYVVVWVVLLEGTADIVRFLACLLLSPPPCALDVLILFPGDEHGVQVIIQALIDGDPLLEQHPLLLPLLLGLLPLFLLSLILLIVILAAPGVVFDGICEFHLLLLLQLLLLDLHNLMLKFLDKVKRCLLVLVIRLVHSGQLARKG